MMNLSLRRGRAAARGPLSFHQLRWHDFDWHILLVALSLLAFGLLAFSATPALHYLGLTCLIGLTAVWALVYLLRPGPRGAPE